MSRMDNGVQFALGLSLGIVAGALATILLAPQSGRRTRQEFEESTLQEADTLTQRLMDILEDEAERLARRVGDELLEMGRSIFEQQQARLRAGVDGNSEPEYKRA